MTIAEAIQIVLDLARQNICDEHDMPEEHERQENACSLVESMAADLPTYFKR